MEATLHSVLVHGRLQGRAYLEYKLSEKCLTVTPKRRKGTSSFSPLKFANISLFRQ